MINKLIDITLLFEIFIEVKYYKYNLYLTLKPIIIDLIKNDNIGLIKIKDLNLKDEDLKDLKYFLIYSNKI